MLVSNVSLIGHESIECFCCVVHDCEMFSNVFYGNDVKFPKTYSTPQTLDDDAQSDLMAQFPARILGNASQNGLKGFVFQ